jgi:hypothetical protein
MIKPVGKDRETEMLNSCPGFDSLIEKKLLTCFGLIDTRLVADCKTIQAPNAVFCLRPATHTYKNVPGRFRANT